MIEIIVIIFAVLAVAAAVPIFCRSRRCSCSGWGISRCVAGQLAGV